MQVDLTYVELRKGDILLLCSDGLSGMVRFEEIRELLDLANERGKRQSLAADPDASGDLLRGFPLAFGPQLGDQPGTR